MPIVKKSAGNLPDGICELIYKRGDKEYHASASLMGDYILTCQHCGMDAQITSITCSPELNIDIKDIIKSSHPSRDLGLIQLSKTYPTSLSLPDINSRDFIWRNYNDRDVFPLDNWGHGGNPKEPAQGFTAMPDAYLSANRGGPYEMMFAVSKNGRIIRGDSGGPALFWHNNKAYVFGVNTQSTGKASMMVAERVGNSTFEVIASKDTLEWIHVENTSSRYALGHRGAFISGDKAKIKGLLEEIKEPADFIKFFQSKLNNPSEEYAGALKKHLNLNLDQFLALNPSPKDSRNLLEIHNMSVFNIKKILNFQASNIKTFKDWLELEKLLDLLHDKKQSDFFVSGLSEIIVKQHENLERLSPSLNEIKYSLGKVKLEKKDIDNLINMYLAKIQYKHEFKNLEKLVVSLGKDVNYFLPAKIKNRINNFKMKKYAGLPSRVDKYISSTKYCLKKAISLLIGEK